MKGRWKKRSENKTKTLNKTKNCGEKYFSVCVWSWKRIWFDYYQSKYNDMFESIWCHTIRRIARLQSVFKITICRVLYAAIVNQSSNHGKSIALSIADTIAPFCPVLFCWPQKKKIWINSKRWTNVNDSVADWITPSNCLFERRFYNEKKMAGDF